MEKKYFEITNKNGVKFSDMIEASKGKDTVIIGNFALDDEYINTTQYLLSNKIDEVVIGIKDLAVEAKAIEIIIYFDEKMDVENLKTSFENVSTNFKVKIHQGPASLVLREESALYNALDKGEIRSCPMEKTFLTEGYQGKATIIIDAETSYRLAKNNYKKLIKVHNNNECIWVEANLGDTIQKMLENISIDMSDKILVGGSLGKFISRDQAATKKISYNYLFDSIYMYDSSNCMCNETKELFINAWEQSCGKCVLCREGTYQLKTIFSDITEGKGKKGDLDLISDVCELIQIGAFCDYGKNMAKLAISTVEVNRKEFDTHIAYKRCDAGVCNGYSYYAILPKKCKGCGACLNVCEEKAIEGKPGYIHMIDIDMCENCGKCMKVCKENAIKRPTGRVKLPKRLMRVGRF